MLAVLYILIFIVGVVLGGVIFAGALEIHFYGGEVNVAEEKFYTEDWIYDDPKRHYALIKINRGDNNEK